jgi:predicted dehydrogenase
MGKIHARNLAKKRVCSFAGVYDTDPLKIHEAENVGYKTFKSLEDLAKASDALLFATPTPLHRKNVQEGLELDKDILLEKPSSTSVRDDEEMEKLMKKYGRIVAVNYPERFNKAVNRARGIDFSKVFLTLSLRINPPPEYRRIDSGLIFDLPVHDIDVLYYWTGLEPVVNYCKIEKNKITMSLRVGNIESNIWAIRISGIDYMYRHVEVFGMKRYFHLDYGQL